MITFHGNDTFKSFPIPQISVGIIYNHEHHIPQTFQWKGLLVFKIDLHDSRFQNCRIIFHEV